MDNIPYGYCHCGCGEKTNIRLRSNPKRGTAKGEPANYLIGHHRRKSPLQYLVDEQTGCWIWQRGVGSHGYGVFRETTAHRIFYQEAYGSIPKGLQIDHLCRNRLCVNPSHLEAVTSTENNRRCKTTRLTIEDVQLIRQLAPTTPFKELAKRFGVDVSHIGHIVSRRNWV